MDKCELMEMVHTKDEMSSLIDSLGTVWET